jgi:hypothetical protein
MLRNRSRRELAIELGAQVDVLALLQVLVVGRHDLASQDAAARGG